MKRAVDHGAMSVVGYTTPWSATAGQPVNLHLSCDRTVGRVSLCRLDTPNTELLDWRIEATGDVPAHRDFDQGSFLMVPSGELAKAGSIDGLGFEVLLTRNTGWRTIVDAGAFRLRLRDGAMFLEHGERVLIAEAKVPPALLAQRPDRS